MSLQRLKAARFAAHHTGGRPAECRGLLRRAGDKRDPKFDGFRQSLQVSFLGTNATIDIWIVPRQEYADQFFRESRAASTSGGAREPSPSAMNRPRGASALPPLKLAPHLSPAVALAIVGGIAIAFTVFDLLSRRHTRALSVHIASARLEAKSERELLQRQTVFARMVCASARPL